MSKQSTFKRNGKIEFLRFIFACFIMILHTGYRPQLDIGGYTFRIGERGGFAVVFFFIPSGYLLSDSVNRHLNDDKEDLGSDNIRFIIKKYKQYITWYIPAFVLCALLDGVQNGIVCMLKNCVKSIPSLLLLGSLGYSSDAASIGYYVGASWYISALFISQIILYPLLRWNYRRYIQIFAPILFIATFCVNVLGKSDNISFAIMCIVMGQFCYETVRYISGYSIGKTTGIGLRILEVILYLMCFLFMSISGFDDYTYGMRFVAAFAIILSFSRFTEYKFMNSPFFLFLGRISFPMYLLHIKIYKWAEYFFMNNGRNIQDNVFYPLLYVTIIILSAIAYEAEKYLKKRCK